MYWCVTWLLKTIFTAGKSILKCRYCCFHKLLHFKEYFLKLSYCKFYRLGVFLMWTWDMLWDTDNKNLLLLILLLGWWTQTRFWVFESDYGLIRGGVTGYRLHLPCSFVWGNGSPACFPTSIPLGQTWLEVEVLWHSQANEIVIVQKQILVWSHNKSVQEATPG